MIEFENKEDVEILFETLFPTKNQEDLSAVHKLKKLFLKQIVLKPNKEKEKEIQEMTHKLAELEEEVDLKTQELAFLRKDLCKEILKDYQAYLKELDVTTKLILPQYEIKNSIDNVESQDYNDIKSSCSDLLAKIRDECLECEQTKILVNGFVSKGTELQVNPLIRANEYFRKFHK
ncbi:hypothetical protein EDEG_00139 [Edhazardia aedis USNM 41457]|uniref:Uncharacterized protein n=1 Tax=Edhazardia aedis (strain USNM 41457) TaxID=1003232 RepID=J9DA12_EDHAE|nr:hypothetical protein EDEG_00139 [Edhazardia aedis USNM 41457]|eukprot:EJW04354.1 hypothetical protein EDEG_00139 [Edhazardia aedis USNM 41457]